MAGTHGKDFQFRHLRQNCVYERDDAKKREILLTLGQNQILGNQKLTMDIYSWFVPITEDYPALKEKYEKVGTDKNLSPKARTEALASVRAQWSECRESDPGYKTPSLAYYHYTTLRK